MSEIKPEDVRKGDRIRLTRTASSNGSVVVEGLVGVIKGSWCGVQGLGVWDLTKGTIELLDRPKTPGQVAYEAYRGERVSWQDLTHDLPHTAKRFDAIAQAVLDHAKASA